MTRTCNSDSTCDTHGLLYSVLREWNVFVSVLCMLLGIFGCAILPHVSNKGPVEWLLGEWVSLLLEIGLLLQDHSCGCNSTGLRKGCTRYLMASIVSCSVGMASWQPLHDWGMNRSHVCRVLIYMQSTTYVTKKLSFKKQFSF